MLPIPDDRLKPFDAIMGKKAILPSHRADYRKWLRYYLDFRTLLLQAHKDIRTIKEVGSPLDF